MALIQTIRWRELPWAWLLLALVLTTFGVAFVISARYDPASRFGLGLEAKVQMVWWVIALIACFTMAHVPLAVVRSMAIPCYLIGLALELFMMAAAGSSLVPVIRGQANWLILGPMRLQPIEFIKVATLLACARCVSAPRFLPGRLSHVFGALAIAALPALLHARADLGSSMVFPFMILGMLVAVGMRYRHLVLLILIMIGCVVALTLVLPKEGPKAYQYKRIQAWLHPDAYALTEGYQTMRSVRSIGSGQIVGKGYGAGDQNRLGWLPENHTDLIFAVVGEEVGFVGCSAALGLFLLFAWAGLHAAGSSRDPFGSALIVGYVCMLMGQASINLAVAMGLMPVTGVPLPFFSYGGSSLLACYLGLGMGMAAAIALRSDRHRTGTSGTRGGTAF